MTPQDPFDDLLRAYLRTRADVQAPGDLVANALASGRPAPSSSSRLRLAFGLAAVAVTAILIVSRALYVPLPAPIARSATPAAGATAGATDAGGTPGDPALAAAGFPATVLGLPVISVADARAIIADGEHQGRAMAVGGWWSSAVMQMSCPAPDVYKSVIQGYCSLTALAPTDAPFDHYFSSGIANGGTSSSESFDVPPTALIPRVVPETAGYDQQWKDVAPGAADREVPQRVVLIGHVGDPRAWECAANVFQACQEEFVVDAFAWVEGRFIDAWNDRGGPMPGMIVEEARALVQMAVPQGRLVTISPWDHTEVPDLDPRIGSGSGTFWLARSIVGPTDAQGTASLLEVVIDDASGANRTLDMSFAPGSEPGGLQFQDAGDAPAISYVAVRDSHASVVDETYLQLWSIPAVLPAGDYAVDAWAGVDSPQLPDPPADPTCVADVHVISAQVISVTVTWQAQGYCVIGPSPAATPF